MSEADAFKQSWTRWKGSVAPTDVTIVDIDTLQAALTTARGTIAELVEALNLCRQWMGPGQRNHPDVYDSLREEAWDKGTAALSRASRGGGATK